MEQQATKKVENLHPDQIKEYWNAREDYGDIEGLAESIIEKGVIEPIKVWKDKDENGNTIYYLTEGHRRTTATKLAMEKYDLDYTIYIPAIIEPKRYGQADRVIDQLTLNNGKHLTPVEQGKAIHQAVQYGWRIADIARQSGKNYQTIRNHYHLYNSVPKLKEAVQSNKISYSAALEIIKEKDHDAQLKALKNIQQQISDQSSDKSTEKIKKKDVEQPKRGKKSRTEKIRDLLNDRHKNLNPYKMEVLNKLCQYQTGDLNFKELTDFMKN